MATPKHQIKAGFSHSLQYTLNFTQKLNQILQGNGTLQQYYVKTWYVLCINFILFWEQSNLYYEETPPQKISNTTATKPATTNITHIGDDEQKLEVEIKVQFFSFSLIFMRLILWFFNYCYHSNLPFFLPY